MFNIQDSKSRVQGKVPKFNGLDLFFGPYEHVRTSGVDEYFDSLLLTNSGPQPRVGPVVSLWGRGLIFFFFHKKKGGG